MDIHGAYQANLYSTDSTDATETKHLLECVGDIKECENESDKRLSELYFVPAYYDAAGTQPLKRIGSFGILPDAINGNITPRANLLTELQAACKTESESLQASSIEQISEWFTARLATACVKLANVDLGGDDVDLSTLQSAEFRRQLLDNDYPDPLKNNYSNPDIFRPYMAWKHIDHMYPQSERKDYFMIERMHTLTKIVFILSILKPDNTAQEDTVILDLLNKIMTFLVKQSLEFESVGNPHTNSSVDDVAKSNIELSRDVRDNSDVLLNNKEVVQKTQDNLRSLVDVDKHVQSARNRAWYTMVLLVVILALSVAGMAYAYARGRTGEVYLVGGVLILGVVAFESLRGAERLMALPASVFG